MRMEVRGSALNGRSFDLRQQLYNIDASVITECNRSRTELDIGRAITSLRTILGRLLRF